MQQNKQGEIGFNSRTLDDHNLDFLPTSVTFALNREYRGVWQVDGVWMDVLK